MKLTHWYVVAAAVVVVPVAAQFPQHLLSARPQVTVTVFAAGLNDPRGLAFGADKRLYVAEAGSGGGSLSTVGQCEQVAPPVGPFLAGYTARIVSISPSGETTVVAD